MKQQKRNSFIISVLFICALFLAWSNIINLETALAQTSLVPAPNLQDEQTAELLTQTDLPPEVKSAVLNDAVKRTSKTVAALKITEARSQQWSDGCLGLAKADELCTQAITPGWQIVVTDGLRNWTYRTDNTGDAVRLEDVKS